MKFCGYIREMSIRESGSLDNGYSDWVALEYLHLWPKNLRISLMEAIWSKIRPTCALNGYTQFKWAA
jgi:hypothetical protein